MNGVIPSAASKLNVWPLDERLVKDQLGTLYMIKRNVEEIEQSPEFKAVREFPVAVVGCGYTGKLICDMLPDAGFKVFGFDKYQDNVDIKGGFYGDRYESISKACLVILMTGRGNDGISTIIPYLKRGSVLLSDTHPKPSSDAWERVKNHGIRGFESAMTLKGARFFPAMPAWNKDTMPGCTIQAITEAEAGKSLETFNEFCEQADRMGFESRLDIPECFRL